MLTLLFLSCTMVEAFTVAELLKHLKFFLSLECIEPTIERHSFPSLSCSFLLMTGTSTRILGFKESARDEQGTQWITI
jgi:hypothetical protein